MKQEILINSAHEFNLVTEDNVYKLFYSNASHWSTPEEFVLGLKDTGAGFKLLNRLRKKNHIDYDEGEMLYILLAAVKESKIEIVESKKEL